MRARIYFVQYYTMHLSQCPHSLYMICKVMQMAQRICKIHSEPDLDSNSPALTDERKYKQHSSCILSSGFTNSGLLFLIKMDCYFLM